MGAAVSHFLNCLTGSTKVTAMAQQDSDNSGSAGAPVKKVGGGKKKRKAVDKNNPHLSNGTGPTPKSMAWTKLTQDILWKTIGEDSESHYGLRILSAW